jgi:high-affinity iron transporter
MQAAQTLAVSAYLDGFELVEASLDAIDRRHRMTVEAEMMRYRAMLKNQEPTAAVAAQGDRVQGLLAETATLLAGTRLPAGAVFFSAFVILLREGLEAVLVLAYANRWQAFLQEHLRTALSARTMWALTLVSFLAVYREAFETVLFYQALWAQAAPAYVPLLSGLLVAAVTLVGLGWLLFRGSIHLPLGLFFGTTSALLVLLAVIFAGQGIAALQEAGTLPVEPVNFPGIPALGVYPDLLGLLLQAGLILIIAGVFVYTYSSVKEM